MQTGIRGKACSGVSDSTGPTDIRVPSKSSVRRLANLIETSLKRAPSARREWVAQHLVFHSDCSYFVIPNLYSCDPTNEDECCKSLALNQLAGILQDLRLIRSPQPGARPRRLCASEVRSRGVQAGGVTGLYAPSRSYWAAGQVWEPIAVYAVLNEIPSVLRTKQRQFHDAPYNDFVRCDGCIVILRSGHICARAAYAYAPKRALSS